MIQFLLKRFLVVSGAIGLAASIVTSNPSFGVLSRAYEDPSLSGAKVPSPNSSRLLLSDLRGGDYAHAGDAEAINIVIDKALSFDPTMRTSPALDVGSGFGGTVNYLYQKGFTLAEGCDVDPAPIAYAQDHYSSLTFTAVDALSVSQYYPPPISALSHYSTWLMLLRTKRLFCIPFPQSLGQTVFWCFLTMPANKMLRVSRWLI